MEIPKKTRKRRHPVCDNQHPEEDHSDKIFSMFDGSEETATLRCRPNMLNMIVVQFWTELNIKHQI